jgi:DivIVA domain-containing protein
VTGADLRALRFNTAVRGYRAGEVDALIDRLAAQLDAATDQRAGDERAGDRRAGDERMDEPGGPAPDGPQ